MAPKKLPGERSNFRKGLLSVLAGVLTALASPGFDLDFLIWLSIIPLFFALDEEKSGGSFALSYGAGLAFFGVLLYWLFTLREWAGVLVLPAYLLLIAYLSLYWGAFGFIYAFLRKYLRTTWCMLAAPAAWITLEFVKAQGIFGFTWGDLGYALYQRPELMQVASLAGIWGVSFAIVFVNYVLYLAVKLMLQDRRVRAGVLYLLGAVATLGLLLIGGKLAIATGERASVSEADLRVAVVQSSVDQRFKMNSRSLHEVLRSYEELLNSIDREVDLIVLPETILLAGFPLGQPELLQPFVESVRKNRAYMILGLPDRRENRFYNSAALLSPQGEVLGVYDKVHLVPFGEFLPLRGVWARLGLANVIEEVVPGDYSPGRSFSPLEAPWGKAATLISFESIFPHIAREFTRNGAQLLVAITNEAWYQASYALPQHFAMGVFRAVENRRFFVQSSNAGLSGVISPWGELVAQSPWQAPAIVYATVSLRDDLTWYARYGDWLVYLAFLYLGICASVGRQRAHPSKQST